MVRCREAEVKTLEKLLKAEIPVIFVHGAPQSGKKMVVRAATTKIKGAAVAHVSCHLGHCGAFVVLEEILAQLGIGGDDPHCQNVSDFAVTLKNQADTRIVICLYHSEMLRQMDFNLFPSFLRLRDISGIDSISVVICSKVPWINFELDAMANGNPPTICLQSYSKNQMVSLLAEQLSLNHGKEQGLVGLDKEVRDHFVFGLADVIHGTFNAVCRTLPQFVEVAEKTWARYIEPFEQGRIEADNSRALYRNVEPFLKECLMTANLKETSDDFKEHQESRLSVELPFFSKFLLISAFICSHNPVSSDKRFFMKNHGSRTKKSRNTVAQAAKIAAHKRSNQLLGPKAFTMDRMLAIFYVIVDMQGVQSSSEILTQVASLVRLNLLTQVGNLASVDSGLDSPKFKCNVSLDFIRLVSKNVRFDIHNYLYDLQ